MEEIIKSYKGFSKDMTCKGKQYAEGETFTEDDTKCCDRGMHACEYPLDCFSYYEPANSIYHEVEQSGKLDRKSDDTKVASTIMKVGARLDIRGLVHAAIEYTKSRTTTEYTDPVMATAGDYGAATAGNSGAATAGDKGAATAGYKGAATAGNSGAATAGDYGAATAGYKGAATAGNSGAATAGDYGAATAGYKGAATSRGRSASGEDGLSVARGNDVKVKGGLGAVLVIVEEKRSSYNIDKWKAAVVDGEQIKADTWYKLKDGEFVECGEEDE